MARMRSGLLVLAAASFFAPLFLFAAQNTFTVSQTINGDLTPPTTPSILSVTPITYSQIDVVWGASTDNILMGGYQIFRDAVQVATTTLLSFSDTGLSPSTTYAYSVRAFDAVGNLSTTSASVATTTYGLPAATTTPESEESVSRGGGGLTQVTLGDLLIESGEREAHLMWQTNLYTQYSLRWGRTGSYELGYIVTDVFSREHSTHILDLEPGTVYEYELVSHDKFGRDDVLSRGQFVTESSPDTTAPPNISDFRATVIDSDVRLSWSNPEADDLAYVRIVRSHLFYPRDPSAGYIVYQGNEEIILDTHALRDHKKQYYTAFVYDQNGNISSGAVLLVSASGLEVVAPTYETPDIGTRAPDTTTADTSGSAGKEVGTDTKYDDLASTASTTMETALGALSFADVELIQDGVLLKNKPGTDILVDGSEPLTVRLSYERLPAHLKTIMVTFTDTDRLDRTSSFFLRVNKDKTAYEAVVAPFLTQSLFEMKVSIFDYKDQVSKDMIGFLQVEHDPSKIFQENIDPLLFLMTSVFAALFVVSLFLFILARRRREDQ